MVDANGILKRPSYSDDYVRRRAAELALEQVKGWDCGESTDADLLRDLMKCLTAAGGYESAKNLEEKGWSPDARLVEILDNDFLERAKKEMTEKWVICIRVDLPLAVGTEVLYRGMSGVIVDRREATAEYCVRTPEMKDTSYYVCLKEDVKLAVQNEVAA